MSLTSKRYAAYGEKQHAALLRDNVLRHAHPSAATSIPARTSDGEAPTRQPFVPDVRHAPPSVGLAQLEGPNGTAPHYPTTDRRLSANCSLQCSPRPIELSPPFTVGINGRHIGVGQSRFGGSLFGALANHRQNSARATAARFDHISPAERQTQIELHDELMRQEDARRHLDDQERLNASAVLSQQRVLLGRVADGHGDVAQPVRFGAGPALMESDNDALEDEHYASLIAEVQSLRAEVEAVTAHKGEQLSAGKSDGDHSPRTIRDEPQGNNGATTPPELDDAVREQIKKEVEGQYAVNDEIVATLAEIHRLKEEKQINALKRELQAIKQELQGVVDGNEPTPSAAVAAAPPDTMATDAVKEPLSGNRGEEEGSTGAGTDKSPHFSERVPDDEERRRFEKMMASSMPQSKQAAGTAVHNEQQGDTRKGDVDEPPRSDAAIGEGAKKGEGTASGTQESKQVDASKEKGIGTEDGKQVGAGGAIDGTTQPPFVAKDDPFAAFREKGGVQKASKALPQQQPALPPGVKAKNVVVGRMRQQSASPKAATATTPAATGGDDVFAGFRDEPAGAQKASKALPQQQPALPPGVKAENVVVGSMRQQSASPKAATATTPAATGGDDVFAGFRDEPAGAQKASKALPQQQPALPPGVKAENVVVGSMRQQSASPKAATATTPAATGGDDVFAGFRDEPAGAQKASNAASGVEPARRTLFHGPPTPSEGDAGRATPMAGGHAGSTSAALRQLQEREDDLEKRELHASKLLTSATKLQKMSEVRDAEAQQLRRELQEREAALADAGAMSAEKSAAALASVRQLQSTLDDREASLRTQALELEHRDDELNTMEESIAVRAARLQAESRALQADTAAREVQVKALMAVLDEREEYVAAAAKRLQQEKEQTEGAVAEAEREVAVVKDEWQRRERELSEAQAKLRAREASVAKREVEVAEQVAQVAETVLRSQTRIQAEERELAAKKKLLREAKTGQKEDDFSAELSPAAAARKSVAPPRRAVRAEEARVGDEVQVERESNKNPAVVVPPPVAMTAPAPAVAHLAAQQATLPVARKAAPPPPRRARVPGEDGQEPAEVDAGLRTLPVAKATTAEDARAALEAIDSGLRSPSRRRAPVQSSPPPKTVSPSTTASPPGAFSPAKALPGKTKKIDKRLAKLAAATDAEQNDAPADPVRAQKALKSKLKVLRALAATRGIEDTSKAENDDSGGTTTSDSDDDQVPLSKVVPRLVDAVEESRLHAALDDEMAFPVPCDEPSRLAGDADEEMKAADGDEVEAEVKPESELSRTLKAVAPQRTKIGALKTASVEDNEVLGKDAERELAFPAVVAEPPRVASIDPEPCPTCFSASKPKAPTQSSEDRPRADTSLATPRPEQESTRLASRIEVADPAKLAASPSPKREASPRGTTNEELPEVKPEPVKATPVTKKRVIVRNRVVQRTRPAHAESPPSMGPRPSPAKQQPPVVDRNCRGTIPDDEYPFMLATINDLADTLRTEIYAAEEEDWVAIEQFAAVRHRKLTASS